MKLQVGFKMKWTLLFAVLFFTSSLFSEDSKEKWFTDWPYEPFQIDKFTINGSLSYRYVFKDYGEKDTRAGDVDFDRFALTLGWSDGPLTASATYSFYRFEDYATWVTFLKEAWIDYQFNDNSSIRAGVTLVPFGITKFATHSWWESPGYYLGLEEDYDLGAVYTWKNESWKFDFAYFLRDEGTWLSNGRSDHSSRYSADVVPEGTSGNKERNQFNFRSTYTVHHDEDKSSDFIFSLQYGLIPNNDTGDTGDHYALGLAYHGKLKPWEIKLSWIHYNYNLKNPDGQSKNVVQFGYFDTFPYNAAKQGDLFIASVSRKFEVNWGPISSVTPYTEFSYLKKHKNSWPDSQQFSVGAIWAIGKWSLYSEVYWLKEHPDLGEGTFPNGFASGSGNSAWHTFVLFTLAYYF